MGKVIYWMNTSLDGFIEGPDGRFDWGAPDDELHRFYNQQARELDAFVHGRRMYETMSYWDTAEANPDQPDAESEFAEVWKTKSKFVFSNTLTEVGPGYRLMQGDPAAALAQIRQEVTGDLGVGGPGLACEFAKLNLIDEFRIVLIPVLVGGGKPYFPLEQQQVPLKLLETKIFDSGVVYLRYHKA